MKTRTSEIIYNQMMFTTPEKVANTTINIFDRIQVDKPHNQILGLAAALICMLDEYDLNHSDVLGMAHNYVYSGENNNMKPDFKAMKRYMKNEWEL